jgi:hypothetical protein
MQPSDSLPPSAPAPVPLAGGLPRCECLFYAPWADDTCTRRRVVRRRRVTGSPLDRHVSRRGEGLPGYGVLLFVRALVEHPAGYVPLFARCRRGALLPSMESSTLGIRKDIGFGAAVPRPARSSAYASPAVSPRPAQGWLPARAGSPLAGQDSHLLDDKQSFMKASHPPIPFDPQGLVALYFLLCCRCCQALLRIFLPCILWALCHLAPSGLAASLGVGTSRLQRPAHRAGFNTLHPSLDASFDDRRQACGR